MKNEEIKKEERRTLRNQDVWDYHMRLIDVVMVFVFLLTYPIVMLWMIFKDIREFEGW